MKEEKEWKGKYFTDKDTITPENTPEVDRVVKVSELTKETKETKKTKEKVSPKKKKREGKRKAGAFFLLLLIIVICAGLSFGAAWLAAWCNHESFSIFRHWPLMAASFVAAFCTTGFFSSHDKHEWVYGIFSILGVLCFIAELVLMFH